MNEQNLNSILKLQHCVFDEISFKRKGFRNNNQAQFKIAINIFCYKEHEYCVSLIVAGEKPEEYDIVIRLSGYFAVVGSDAKISEDTLIKKNAVAILFPYIRSEISLLTSQPETNVEILPVLNVSEIEYNEGALKED
jgi:preprotein translocase subunit SecB